MDSFGSHGSFTLITGTIFSTSQKASYSSDDEAGRHRESAVGEYEDAEREPDRVRRVRSGIDTVNYQPSATERLEHELSHMPYRPWCSACRQGRSLLANHLNGVVEGSDDFKNEVIQADHGYVGGRLFLALYDKKSREVWAQSSS